MNAFEAANRLLYATLSGDATLTALLSSATAVYDSLAPQGTPTKYVIFQYMGGSIESRFGTDHSIAMESMPYLVKVVDQGEDANPANAAFDRVDSLLTMNGVTSNGWVFNIWRASRFYLPTFVDSTHYRQVGGRYRVVARLAT